MAVGQQINRNIARKYRADLSHDLKMHPGNTTNFWKFLNQVKVDQVSADRDELSEDDSYSPPFERDYEVDTKLDPSY